MLKAVRRVAAGVPRAERARRGRRARASSTATTSASRCRPSRVSSCRSSAAATPRSSTSSTRRCVASPTRRRRGRSRPRSSAAARSRSRAPARLGGLLVDAARQPPARSAILGVHRIERAGRRPRRRDRRPADGECLGHVRPPRRRRHARGRVRSRRDRAAPKALGVPTLSPMGGWYWIGVSVGLGTGAGVLLVGVVTGLLGATRLAIVAAALIAALSGAAIGHTIDASEPGGWANVFAGVLGGISGTLAAAQIVGGALRRGGTRGGTAAIVGVSGIALGALSLVPGARLRPRDRPARGRGADPAAAAGPARGSPHARQGLNGRSRRSSS